jgi:DNA-directed RNA polymerase specialized sigma24 family protein
MAGRMELPCAELHRLYLEEGMGVAELGALMGRSPSTISNWLQRCGVRTRSGRFQHKLVSQALLRQLYSEEALPLRVIAARLGVSTGTIRNRLRAYEIPLRREQGAPTRRL